MVMINTARLCAIIEQAICLFFQGTHRITVSTLSQINSLCECNILPKDLNLDLIKRMHKGALAKCASAQHAIPLHERAVFSVSNVMEFLCPFTFDESLLLEVSDAEFFIALALVTGHHVGESWVWQPSFYHERDGTLFYPAFKFHDDKIVKIGSMYKCLHSYLQIFRPQWLSGSCTPPAQRLWPNVEKMGSSIANILSHYLPGGTHRLLRRTYASILNALHAPVELIQRQLLHKCDEAIDNYVVIYGEDEAKDLCDIFSFTSPFTFMPDDCAQFMQPSPPRSFVPRSNVIDRISD